MPDTEETVVVQFSLKVPLARLAAMLLRAEAEQHPEIVAALAAVEPAVPAPPPDRAQEPPPEAPAEDPGPLPGKDAPAPSPVREAASRPPRAGKTSKVPPVKAVVEEPVPEPEPEPPEPEPEPPAKPLEEADVRAVLRSFSAVVPGRDTAVVALLREVGGAPRLADCDKAKWPAIVAAAQQAMISNQAAD